MQVLTYENILGESITFAGSGGSPPYHLKHIDGIGSTRARISPVEANIYDGDIIYGATKEYRVVDLTFHVGHQDIKGLTNMFESREKLQGILALEKAFNPQTKQMAKITYQNDYGTFYTYGIPELDLRFKERMLRFNTDILLSFRCPSAYWRGKSTTIQLGDSGLGAFSLPFEFPISFAQTSYEATAMNQSAVTTPLEIWVYGNGEKPILENLSTGKRLVFDVDLLTGEYLHINTDPKNIVCEIYKDNAFVSKGFKYLSPLTPITEFNLRTGANTIKYSPTTAQAGSVIVMRWNTLYEGV